MLKRNEDGNTYAMFRQRIMIPIRNRWGRIIAYTARYIGRQQERSEIYQLRNLPDLFQRGNLFGIDRVNRLRNVDYIIVVEGAPDVLRMQSIGYDNTVAALGTSWTDSQFEQLKKIRRFVVLYTGFGHCRRKVLRELASSGHGNGAAAIKKDSIRQSENCLS